jgi:hypothetical protein
VIFTACCFHVVSTVIFLVQCPPLILHQLGFFVLICARIGLWFSDSVRQIDWVPLLPVRLQSSISHRVPRLVQWCRVSSHFIFFSSRPGPMVHAMSKALSFCPSVCHPREQEPLTGLCLASIFHCHLRACDSPSWSGICFHLPESLPAFRPESGPQLLVS